MLKAWVQALFEVLKLERVNDRPLNSGKGAASFDPKIYKADRNLKLSKDIIKMLKLHPRERKPDMVDKIMRAIQLILDTFADYPLGLVISPLFDPANAFPDRRTFSFVMNCGLACFITR